MTIRSVVFGLFAFVLFLVASSPATGLANRVFVSARSGNNANACDHIRTPCQTFAGAVTQLNPKGEVIVLDSGGYGPVTITQAVTIEAPPGVTAFIHPPSGDAITINAGSSDVVTLRGPVLNTGTANGITINSVGTLNIESCSISGFAFHGILWVAAGRLNLKNADVTDCLVGALIDPATGQGSVSVDHCHFDGNTQGYWASTDAPGATSTTIATNSTASNNSAFGWLCGGGSPGTDTALRKQRLPRRPHALLRQAAAYNI